MTVHDTRSTPETTVNAAQRVSGLGMPKTMTCLMKTTGTRQRKRDVSVKLKANIKSYWSALSYYFAGSGLVLCLLLMLWSSYQSVLNIIHWSQTHARVDDPGSWFAIGMLCLSVSYIFLFGAFIIFFLAIHRPKSTNKQSTKNQ